MAALSAIGPLGRHPAVAMLFYGSGFILMIGMVRTFPKNLQSSHAFFLVAALGIAARAAFIFFPPNTDVYRYIWEGAIQNYGFNPYLFAPADPAVADLAHGEVADIWQRINNKALSAIYPPIAMLFFRLLAWISPTPVWFKTVFLLFDLGSMAVLALMLRQRNLPASRLLLYAANPLVVVFIAGEAHLDSIQVFLVMLAVYFLLNCRHALGIFFIGVAAMIKYLAALVAPLFWRRHVQIKQVTLFLAPSIVFFVYISAGWKLFGSFAEFGTNMHYNDGLMEILRLAIGGAAPAVAGAIFIFALVWTWLTEDDSLRGIYLAFAWLLVLLPTLHPWYLMLIAPFMSFFPSRAWLYLQAGMLFTFPVMGHEYRTGVFQEVLWIKTLEYYPFVAVMGWEFFWGGRFLSEIRYSTPQTISVVIPTLNEAAHIGKSIDALKGSSRIGEIIVADGGSTDGTSDIARAHGARVIQAGQGRGVQIRTAAETATGDVLLVVHADAILAKDVAERIIRALCADPGAPGGCFGMAFNGSGGKPAVIAALNNLRAITTGIAFGDQAQFVRAEVLRSIGGFPALMLMEDVELSLQMKRLGRPVYMHHGVTVSGRRWQGTGFLKNVALVLGLFVGYLLERRLGLNPDEKRYYRRYYHIAS
jgi:rSAM/selenodomain-associated transferase 2